MFVNQSSVLNHQLDIIMISMMSMSKMVMELHVKLAIHENIVHTLF